jgi:hypothetical protein
MCWQLQWFDTNTQPNGKLDSADCAVHFEMICGIIYAMVSGTATYISRPWNNHMFGGVGVEFNMRSAWGSIKFKACSFWAWSKLSPWSVAQSSKHRTSYWHGPVSVPCALLCRWNSCMHVKHAHAIAWGCPILRTSSRRSWSCYVKNERITW